MSVVARLFGTSIFAKAYDTLQHGLSATAELLVFVGAVLWYIAVPVPQ